MRAAVVTALGGPEVVELEELPDPEPGPGEVRVRVRATSLNHLDVWVRRGLPHGPPLPHVGGADVAGEVDELGPGVHPSWAGARVVVDPSMDYGWYAAVASGDAAAPRFRLRGEHAPGGMAGYCVVPQSGLVRLPDEVSFETAAAASLVGVTAYRALLVRGGLRAGETVLVTGASGGVATIAVQLARLAGAHVLAVTSGPENVERVRALGAHRVYDRGGGDWVDRIWADTGKRGVDLVLDSVGAALWASNVRSLAVGGRLVTYGATSGAVGDTLLPAVFWKQLTILGSTMGTPAEFRSALRFVFDGRVRPVVHAVLPLAEARRAHELLEGGGVFGKLVLVP